jgi:hypothetical protein
VSAVADPASRVVFYSTELGAWVASGSGGIAASVVAAAFALAGTPDPTGNPVSYLYAHHDPGLVADITAGSTGTCGGPTYYCNAAAGYDGPSGLGSPLSAMALGVHAPSDSLTGGPAVYYPGDGALHVFGTGTANGTVWGDTWKRSVAWSGWVNMGGGLTGKPLSAVYNPASGKLEVYGLASDGHVTENATSDGATWSGWHELGGTVAFGFAPSTVYDPMNGSLELWEVATTGTAFENSWHSGSGWSGWVNRGGLFSTALTPVYDPANGVMRIFGVAKGDNTVWDASFTQIGDISLWSSWQDMDGSLTGALSAVYDPISRDTKVYGRGTSGTVQENFLQCDGEFRWSPRGDSRPCGWRWTRRGCMPRRGSSRSSSTRACRRSTPAAPPMCSRGAPATTPAGRRSRLAPSTAAVPSRVPC